MPDILANGPLPDEFSFDRRTGFAVANNLQGSCISYHSLTFIPSWAIRVSTPRLPAIARSFALSLRLSVVTISEPQWLIMARGTSSFAHHISCVRTGAWPMRVFPRLRMNGRVSVAPSPM